MACAVPSVWAFRPLLLLGVPIALSSATRLSGASGAIVEGRTSSQDFAKLHAVSDAHVSKLCARSALLAINEMGVLDIEEPLTSSIIANALSASLPGTDAMLTTIGVPSGVSFTTVQLCEAAVRAIPWLLGCAVPQEQDRACTDSDCAEVTVDVSIQDLLNDPIMPLPHFPVEASDLKPLLSHDTSEAESISNENPGTLLRALLTTLFQIFPSIPNDIPDLSSFLEASGGPTGQVVTDFDQSFEATHQQKFQEDAQKALAWVAHAVDKVEQKREVIRQYMMSSDERALKEIKSHLFRLLDVLANLHLSKDNCKEGLLAWIKQKCPGGVQEQPCGQRKGNGRYVIYMCDAVLGLAPGYRVGNLVHEASHHFGTKDEAFGLDEVLNLPENKARRNADSYVYLIGALNGVNNYRV